MAALAANLSTRGEWIELESNHYVPMHEGAAAVVTAKTIEMVKALSV